MKKLIKTIFIIDTKVFAKEFVCDKYIKKYKIFTLFITKKINFKLINNFIEHTLTRIIIIKIYLKNYVKKVLCLIILLNKFDLIFDIFWIKKHNVNIKKNNCSLLFKSKHCLYYCISNQQSLKVFNKTLLKSRFKFKLFKKLFFYRKKIDVNCDVVLIEVFIIIITKNNYKIIVL